MSKISGDVFNIIFDFLINSITSNVFFFQLSLLHVLKNIITVKSSFNESPFDKAQAIKMKFDRIFCGWYSVLKGPANFVHINKLFL